MWRLHPWWPWCVSSWRWHWHTERQTNPQEGLNRLWSHPCPTVSQLSKHLPISQVKRLKFLMEGNSLR
jgi:hypothetical protein